MVEKRAKIFFSFFVEKELLIYRQSSGRLDFIFPKIRFGLSIDAIAEWKQELWRHVQVGASIDDLQNLTLDHPCYFKELNLNNRPYSFFMLINHVIFCNLIH